MAIVKVQNVGSNQTSTAATTLSVTPAANITAGNAIIVAIANHNNLAPSSVTDSAGNSYTLLTTAANGTTVAVTLAYCLNCLAVSTAQSITVTWSSARNAGVSITEWSGLATSSALDQTASNTTGSSATPSVGPTATTTQPDELVIGAFGYSNSRTFTAGTGYTALPQAESTGTVRGVASEYKIVASTGAQTADGTFSSSATFAGALATFKAAASGSSVALSASGALAVTGSAALSVVGSAALSASATLAVTGSAALSVVGAAVLGASGTLAVTGSAGLTTSGGPSVFGASGTLAVTGSAGLTTLAAGLWNWTLFQRPLLDRYMNITIACSASTVGYVGVSKDGSTWRYFAAPLAADGRTLTEVASEAAAKLAPAALPTSGRVDLPAVLEARYIKLGHKNSVAYNLIEFYPRRLVEADDIRAESIKAIHIAAGSITADRLSVLSLSAITANLGTVTAGTITGVTISGSTIFAGASSEMKLDSDGITFTPGTGSANIIKWGSGGTYSGGIWSDGTYSGSNTGINLYTISGVSYTDAIVKARSAAAGDRSTYMRLTAGATDAGSAIDFLQNNLFTFRILPTYAQLQRALNVGSSVVYTANGYIWADSDIEAGGKLKARGRLEIDTYLYNSTIDIHNTDAAGGMHLTVYNGEPGVSYTTGGIGFNYGPLNSGASGRFNTSVRGSYIRFNTATGGIDLRSISALGTDNSRLQTDDTGISFFAASTVAKQTVTGSRGANAALTSLLTALANYGLITNSST